MQGASHLLDCLFEEILIVAPTRRAHPAGIRNFDYLVDVEAVDEHYPGGPFSLNTVFHNASLHADVCESFNKTATLATSTAAIGDSKSKHINLDMSCLMLYSASLSAIKQLSKHSHT